MPESYSRKAIAELSSNNIQHIEKYFLVSGIDPINEIMIIYKSIKYPNQEYKKLRLFYKKRISPFFNI